MRLLRPSLLTAADPDAVKGGLDEGASRLPGQLTELAGDARGEHGGEGRLGGGHLGDQPVTLTGAGDKPGLPVGAAQLAAQGEVVSPGFELFDGLVARGPQPGGVLGGLRVEDKAAQLLVDQPADVIVEPLGDDGCLSGAAGEAAGVADGPVLGDVPGHSVPAPGAADQPGEQPVMVGDDLRGLATVSVGALPEIGLDDWRPRVFDDHAAGAGEDAEHAPALDDALDGGGSPMLPAGRTGRAVQGAGDVDPAFALRAQLEDLLDDASGGLVYLDAAVLEPFVTVGNRPGEAPLVGGPALGAAYLFVCRVPVPLGDGEQHVEHETPGGGGRVDLFVDGDDAGTLVGELVDGHDPVHEVAGEAVQAGDDDAAGAPGADLLQGELHAGPLHVAAALVEVLDEAPDLDAVDLRPGLDGFPLGAGGLEAIAAPAGDLTYAYVTNQNGGTHDAG